MRNPYVLVFCAVGLLAGPADTSAQTPRVELWGGVAGAFAGPAGSLASDYSPPLLLDGSDYTSHAGQVLTIDSARAPGVDGGINLFPRGPVGVQVLFDRAAFDVSGTNAAYTETLQYVSRQPPNYVPQTFTVGNSVPWPGTSGSVTQLVVAVNAVVRVGDPGGTNVTLSGGPAIVRLTGTVQPLGYTTYRLGGHAVLFDDEYRLAMAIDPVNAVGFDAGAELNVAVGRRLAAMFGYRYFGGGDVDATAAPAAILNPGDLGLPQSLADVTSRIAPVRARLSIAGSRVVAALKVRF